MDNVDERKENPGPFLGFCLPDKADGGIRHRERAKSDRNWKSLEI